jgi:hypothetical protein
LRAIGKVQRRTGWRAFKVWFVSTNHAWLFYNALDEKSWLTARLRNAGWRNSPQETALVVRERRRIDRMVHEEGWQRWLREHEIYKLEAAGEGDGERAVALRQELEDAKQEEEAEAAPFVAMMKKLMGS